MSSGRERIYKPESPSQTPDLSRTARACAVRTHGYIEPWGPLVVERIHASGDQAQETVDSKNSSGSDRWRVLNPGEPFAERNPNPVRMHGADVNLLKRHSDSCEVDRVMPFF